MITIFSIPKAFAGHNAIIQRNALRSWCALDPRPQIVLCGNDPGVAEVTEEFGVEHIPDIPTTELGTPLLDAAFRKTAEIALYPLLFYTNADILFFNDLCNTIRNIRLRRFLFIGRRIDLDIEKELDFSETGVTERLKEEACKNGQLHSSFGLDYFLFPKGDPIAAMPPFAVGRPGWDGWFVANAWRNGIPIIDATNAVLAIHQNHDYSHVPNRRGDNYDGPEADQNNNLAVVLNRGFGTDDASHEIIDSQVQPRRGMRYIFSRLFRWYHATPKVYYGTWMLRLLFSSFKRTVCPHPHPQQNVTYKEKLMQICQRRRNIDRFFNEQGASDISIR